MAAVACLRVLADEDSSRSVDLVGLVAKLTCAFLETRWVWPRRHGRIGPSAFLLADPRALEFDADELRALAGELQVKLFGVEGAGEVCLLLFEGEQEEIMRFASCADAALKASLDGDVDATAMNGRIRRVGPHGVETLPHRGDPDAAVEATAAAAVTAEELLNRVERAEPSRLALADEPAHVAGFHAVYHPPRQKVIGAAVSNGRLGASSLRGTLANSGHIQGEAARAYDTQCIEACASVLSRPFGGLMFFPLSFSSIVHRPTRELYAATLRQLPAARRAQLAASVYDVPRDPSFTALSQLTSFLGQYFGFIDLCVTDPGFRVEKLSVSMVNSVTLVITETDQKARLAQVRRFMDNRDNYKRQKIWPAVSHIRTKAELDFCLALRAPFVSGPAVSDLLDGPAESGDLMPGELPLRRAGATPLARCA